MEYEIGEFSIITKIPLKTLRYFKEEGFLVPAVDSSPCVLYDERQVPLARRIMMLEEIGILPGDIRRIMDGADMNAIIEKRKKKLLRDAEAIKSKIDEIDGILEEYSATGRSTPELRSVPGCIVCYSRWSLRSPSEIRDMIIDFNTKCEELNPDMKRTDPAYEFTIIMNEDHNTKDLDVMYAVAVESAGKESADIKFKAMNDREMVCMVHKGPYSRLGDTYASAVQWMIDNGYHSVGRVREVFIKGSWNHNTSAYTEVEIQIPSRLSDSQEQGC